MTKNPICKISQPLICALCIVILAIIGGCNKFSDSSNNRIDDIPLSRRIGQIQSLGGIKTTSQGTHLLKLDDDSIILLRSLSINLDDPKYSGKILEVRGYLNYTKSQKQIMDVQNIDVIDTFQTQQKLTVNWKEYVNPALGFEARYRDDFQIKEGSDFVRFTRAAQSTKQSSTQSGAESTTQSGIQSSSQTQEIIDLKQHVILVESSQKNPDSGSTQEIDVKPLARSKIGSNGLDASKKVDDALKKIDFYFNYSGKYYHIGYSGGNDAQNLEDQNIFYDFVNSFRFIKPEIK